MLLVNITRTYPADAIAGIPEGPDSTPTGVIAALSDLVNACRGDWPDLSTRYLSENVDYLAATTTAGRIVGIFRVVDFEHDVDDAGVPKVRFGLEAAPEAAHHLGAPMPGGSWKKGEARGTRAVPTPRDFLPTSDLTAADFTVYLHRTRAVAVAHAEGRVEDSAPEQGPRPYSHGDTSWVEQAEVGGADVRSYPDGVIHVYAPTGARVIVEQR